MPLEIQIVWIGIYLKVLATTTYLGAFVFLFYFLIKINEMLGMKKSKLFLFLYFSITLIASILYPLILVMQLPESLYFTTDYLIFVFSILYLLSIPIFRLRTANIGFEFGFLLLLPISTLIMIFLALNNVVPSVDIFKRSPISASLFVGLVVIYLFRDHFKNITPFRIFFKLLYDFYMSTLIFAGVSYMLGPVIMLLSEKINLFLSFLEPFLFYTASVAFFFNVLTTYRYYKEGKIIR